MRMRMRTRKSLPKFELVEVDDRSWFFHAHARKQTVV